MESTKERTKLSEQLIEKFKSLKCDFNISKSELDLIISNKELKKVFTLINDNIFSPNEIFDFKKRIDFFSLNEDKIKKYHKLKNQKMSLMNEIENKRKLLESIKNKKKHVIDENKKLLTSLNSNKLKEEDILFKKSILELSENKLHYLSNKFTVNDLISQYIHKNNQDIVCEEELIFKNYLKDSKMKLNLTSETQLNKLPQVYEFLCIVDW